MIMKKVIFLMGMVSFYCISCTSSKKNISQVSVKEYYKDNSYADKYKNFPHLLTGDEAKTYINAFKYHTYKGWRKKKLNNAWSTFDRHTLDSLVKDQQTDSIFFFLAAFPRHDKSVLEDSTRHPFIILEAIPKSSISSTGKGDSESSSNSVQPLFFSPVILCPPPDRGCRIPGN
jgi:hypothetical protein